MNQNFEPLKDHPRAVILDTDIGPDCDDVGAIVTLIDYAKQYGFPILGVTNCTSNTSGNGTIDAIFRYCGRTTPPIGQWDKPNFLDDANCRKYNDRVAKEFSPAFADGTLPVEKAVPLYRRLLASQPDDGVMLITIGMFNNLAALLASEPDEYSPLNGYELVKAKVHAVVSMAAVLPQGREFNVVLDVPAAETVCNTLPVPLYLSDFHVGIGVVTGYSHITDPAEIEKNPLALAYHLYTEGRDDQGDNNSFDLTAVQFAVLGEGEFYGLGEPGRLEFYEEIPGVRDATRFVPDPEGNLRFMTLKVAKTVIRDSLNAIIRKY